MITFICSRSITGTCIGNPTRLDHIVPFSSSLFTNSHPLVQSSYLLRQAAADTAREGSESEPLCQLLVLSMLHLPKSLLLTNLCV